MAYMPTKIIIGLITIYRYCLSPIFGRQCRFYPSCSCYAIAAIKVHGLLRGLYLSLLRVGRCNPWCRGGIDNIPSI